MCDCLTYKRQCRPADFARLFHFTRHCRGCYEAFLPSAKADSVSPTERAWDRKSTPAASNRGSFADGPPDWNGPVPAIHREVALSTIGGEAHGLMVGRGGLAKRG